MSTYLVPTYLLSDFLSGMINLLNIFLSETYACISSSVKGESLVRVSPVQSHRETDLHQTV